MPKDPAFLFYYQDFLVGTSFLTNEETGAYIRILAHLADKEVLDEEHMINICITQNIWDSIKSKFVVDNEGNFYNERLREESIKRREYAESRRKNRLGKSKSYDKHMENGNGNEDRIKELKNDKNKHRGEFFENLFNLYLLEFVNKLSLETWKEWVSYRREIKKKLTKSMAEKQLKFLVLQGDPTGCINESIKNGWAGLFELKNNQSVKPKIEGTGRRVASYEQTQKLFRENEEALKKQGKWDGAIKTENKES